MKKIHDFKLLSFGTRQNQLRTENGLAGFSSVAKECKWDNLHNGLSNLGQRSLGGTQAFR